MNTFGKNILDQTKKVANTAGEQTVELFGKINPGAKKLMDDIKSKSGKKKVEEKSDNDDSKMDATKIINSVIDGAYSSMSVIEKKGNVFVGDKEVSRMNCESYESDFANDQMDICKELFAEFRKHSINPLNKMISDKYLMIRWRNGDNSVVCVDSAKHAQIIKILL